MRARMRIGLLAGCLLGLLAAGASHAAAVGLQPVGSFNEPIYVTSPPGDSRLFVVERPGYIQVLHDGVTSQFLDIHTMVDTAGERGLLSMAFDPNYASNGLFYVFFNDNGSGGANAGDIHVDEFHVSSNPNVASSATRRRVMTIAHSSATNHNGGQLQFGKDGLLYISVGEAGNGSNAQSLGNPLGKILRIDPHGAGQGVHGIPATNPFGSSPTPEIWSLGLRNPFRFSFDHQTGDLVIADVGLSTWEEINFAPTSAGLGRGANFGWPNCEGFCSNSAYSNPVFEYPHDDPGGDQAFGCAILGGFVYRGSQIPELAGRYLYADLCTAELRSIQVGTPLATADRAEGAPDALGEPRSFGEDSNCELYVTSSTSVMKIVGSGSQATPGCTAPITKCCPAGQNTTKRCKKHKHHKKKHRAASAKKHSKHKKHKKKCKKHKQHKKKHRK
jgi:glucose/arabinose dehydrogenase